MCAQTADAFHFFTLRHYPDKYPHIRTCFAHGNQYSLINLGRRIQGFEGRPDLFQGAVHPRSSFEFDNVFADSLVHDPHSFRLLAERHGSRQIVAGLDDPYPLGEMESVPGSFPGKVLEDAVDLGIITEQEKNGIWSDNVLRWLYGQKAGEELKRIRG